MASTCRAGWSRRFASRTRTKCGLSFTPCASRRSSAEPVSHPERGRFGPYGGQYVPETLMGALEELEDVWHEAKADTQFQLELAGHRHAFIGRPTPLYAANRLGAPFGGAHFPPQAEERGPNP